MISILDPFTQTFGQILRIIAPMETDEAAPALFAQCRFALVPGGSFSVEAAEKVYVVASLFTSAHTL